MTKELDYYKGNKLIEYETPQWFFDQLNREFEFTLDPCATHENTKCEKYFTVTDNGLEQDWFGNVFMNPPYGRDIRRWVRKAHDEVMKSNAWLVVGLIPSRTDTKWFHRYIYRKAEIRFVQGRIKFLQNGKEAGPAPFPSMVVIWR